MFSSPLFLHARSRLEHELSLALETVENAIAMCENIFNVSEDADNRFGHDMRQEALSELYEQLNFSSKIEKRVKTLMRVLSPHVPMDIVVELSPPFMRDPIEEQSSKNNLSMEEESSPEVVLEQEPSEKELPVEEEPSEEKLPSPVPAFMNHISLDNLPEDEDDASSSSYREEESSDFSVESDSDSVQAPPPPVKRKRDEEDDEEDDDEEEDSFISPSEEDPQVYDGSEYDEYFLGDLPKEKTSRQKKKIVRFEPDAKEDENDDGEDLLPEDLDSEEIQAMYSANDLREWHDLQNTLRQGQIPFQRVLSNTPWFHQRFLLEPIRDNFGREGNNANCLQLYDDLAAEAYSQDNPPKIQHYACIRIPSKDRRCCLCNCPRNCPWSLWLKGDSLPIARTCGNLADQIINFFDVLRTCVDDTEMEPAKAIWYLDRAMTKVQKAHALKSEH